MTSVKRKALDLLSKIKLTDTSTAAVVAAADKEGQLTSQGKVLALVAFGGLVSWSRFLATFVA